MQIIDFVKELNSKEFISNIKVPILNGFQTITNEGTLFTAINSEGFMQQFILDGKLENEESFEDRLVQVITKTKAAMENANLKDVNKSFHFYKDYQTNEFNFKIYIQDNITDSKIIRQFNIYFVDEETSAFYEITLSSCPYDLNNTTLQKEISKDDEITSNMIMTITDIMNNIKHS